MFSPISSAASSNILGTQATSTASTHGAHTKSSSSSTSSVFSPTQDIVTLSAEGQAAAAGGPTGYASPATAEAHSSRAGAATR